MFAHLISKLKHITKVTYLGLHEAMSHSAGQINGAVVLDIYITLVNFFCIISHYSVAYRTNYNKFVKITFFFFFLIGKKNVQLKVNKEM